MNNNISNSIKEYPLWFCPTFLCNWSSSYSKNIKKHLLEVHGYPKEEADEVIDDFFEAYRSGVERINSKDPSDPTNPVHWKGACLLSSEAERSETERSFSVESGEGDGSG